MKTNAAIQEIQNRFIDLGSFRFVNRADQRAHDGETDQISGKPHEQNVCRQRLDGKPDDVHAAGKDPYHDAVTKTDASAIDSNFAYIKAREGKRDDGMSENQYRENRLRP